MKIGYVPYDAGMEKPGDRRRFCGYARRRGLLFEVADPEKTYDVVVVSERGDLSLWSRYRKGRVVFDMVDAYLDVPRTDWKGLLRGAALFASGRSRRPLFNHWEAVRAMCRRADAVVCGSPEQRERILPHCRNTHAVLDFHDMYDKVKMNFDAGEPFRLVWEGLPHNVVFFRLIRSALRSLSRRRPIELNLVTAPRSPRFLGKYWSQKTAALWGDTFAGVRWHDWNESSVPTLATACDLAVIPLPLTDPFQALKPENKLLLFWRMAIPTVASATPAYVRAMDAAGVKMACRTEQEWEKTLAAFMDDAGARRDAAERGRNYVLARHTEDTTLAGWDAVFASLRGGS